MPDYKDSGRAGVLSVRPTWCQEGRHCAPVGHKRPHMSAALRAHFSLAPPVISGQLPLRPETQTEGTGRWEDGLGTTPALRASAQSHSCLFCFCFTDERRLRTSLEIDGGLWSSHKERGLLAERSSAITATRPVL